MKKHLLLLVTFFMAFQLSSFAQGLKKDSIPFLKNTEISGNWFMAYSYNDDTEIDQFHLKRGYFTIKQKLNDIFSVRYTQDITTDREGSDAGNVEIRMKYLYLKMKLKKIDFLKHSFLEMGLVHAPWLDFEQGINRYRIQERMFMDHNRVITSADFGVSLIGLIGGKIDEDYQKNVNKKHPGKYGSYALGIYNGGGNTAEEKNKNKVLAGRLSLRPFPSVMPGMQFSYAFSYGQGNVEGKDNDFNMNLFCISTESKFHVLTMQYYQGKGSIGNRYYDDKNEPYDNDGYSVFGEINIPNTKFAVFARYDEFISDQQPKLKRQTFVGGLAYKFLKNKFILGYNQYKNGDSEINLYEASLDISF